MVKENTSIRPGADEAPSYAPFETLRYDPAAVGAAGEAPGYVRLDRHLARLERSCGWLGVEFDRTSVIDSLRDAVAGVRGAQRVRFTLTADGRPEVEVTPLPMSRFNDTPDAALAAATELLAAGGALPLAAVATQRVDESDPARSHKTTARELYYAGRQVALRLGLDDVIFLDRRGLVAEGSISSVFVVSPERSADVWTPPLSSGALPGVLREELLQRGLVQERELSEHDLRSAGAVLLGSSVRGLRRVDLQSEAVDVA